MKGIFSKAALSAGAAALCLSLGMPAFLSPFDAAASSGAVQEKGKGADPRKKGKAVKEAKRQSPRKAKKETAADIILAKIGDSKLTVAEYEQSFLKNNGGEEAAQKATPEEKEKFLTLLVNYRLKVGEGREKGYADSSDIRAEMKGYRRSLAMSFLLDKQITEPALKEMYERRKVEIRASHIFFRVSPDASPADTAAAYAKAMEAIRMLKQGMPFAAVADSMSEDPGAKTNGGDLYYFSSGMMVTPFENAVYALKKGEFTQVPVRTQFGYHVLEVTDRRPNVKSIHASHILLRFLSPNPSPDDTLKAWRKITAIADSIKNGVDFAELAKRNSEDPGSAGQGGDLGTFERRRMVQEFDETAFDLKPGQVSGIVRTRFGYHIIKVTEIDPIPSYSAMKEELRRIYQRYRFPDEYKAYVDTLKRRYAFSVDSAGVRVLLSVVDSTKTPGDSVWHTAPTAAQEATPVFAYSGATTDVRSILEDLPENQEFRPLRLTAENLRTILDRLSETSIVNYRTRDLETEFPEFRALLKEYEDGILLFRVQQEHIWSRIAPSDSALRAFYADRRGSYSFPDQVSYQEVSVTTDSAARLVVEKYKAGVPFDTLVFRYSVKPDAKTKFGISGLKPASEDTLSKTAWTMSVGDVSAPILVNGYMHSVLKLIEKQPVHPKNYDEAVSEVASQFQEYRAKKLDEEWIQELRAKYPVTVYADALAKTFAQLKKD